MLTAGLATGSRGPHGRAPVGLPGQFQRNRQGIHRRKGLRTCAGDVGRASSGLLLNVGGDLRVRGRCAARTIGIAAPWADSESSEPLVYIEVKDRSVATSGKSQRGFQIDGKWYSHVFDPRSGLPVERVLSATVVADARRRRRRARQGLRRPRARREPRAWSTRCRASNA